MPVTLHDPEVTHAPLSESACIPSLHRMHAPSTYSAQSPSATHVSASNGTAAANSQRTASRQPLPKAMAPGTPRRQGRRIPSIQGTCQQPTTRRTSRRHTACGRHRRRGSARCHKQQAGASAPKRGPFPHARHAHQASQVLHDFPSRHAAQPSWQAPLVSLLAKFPAPHFTARLAGASSASSGSPASHVAPVRSASSAHRTRVAVLRDDAHNQSQFPGSLFSCFDRSQQLKQRIILETKQ